MLFESGTKHILSWPLWIIVNFVCFVEVSKADLDVTVTGVDNTAKDENG